MSTAVDYKFKIASEPWEFEQIHKLCYEAFVEEVPLHNPNPDRALVDKFHNENTYLICVNSHEILAMLSVRGNRPFSLDQKLPNLDSYLPPGRSLCEVRLLNARKDYRRRPVVKKLIDETVKYCVSQGYDIALISSVLQRQRLYEHLGFVPFGPVVGSDNARLQPMYLTTEAYVATQKKHGILDDFAPPAVNLMPGPVQIIPEVRRAFNLPAISHRSQQFVKVCNDTKQLLCSLVNTRYVEIFMGSGTLANDVIAAQLSLQKQKGLILANGEFGQRLIDAANRFALPFQTLEYDWGKPFDYDRIQTLLTRWPKIKWLWSVHCETSTGMLNDINALKNICKQNDISLCLDCVSSIGAANVDLSNVYLASGVSGKALRCYSGLSMVFYNRPLPPSSNTLPRYLDLNTYANAAPVPFTVNSNLLYALRAALENIDIKDRLKNIAEMSQCIKKNIRELGLEPLVPDRYASDSVITIELPPEFSSETVGDRLKDAGFLLSYRSSYLLRRNWIQICLMSDFSKDSINPLIRCLRRILNIS